MRKLELKIPIMTACGVYFNHMPTVKRLDEAGVVGAIVPKAIGPEKRPGNKGPTNYHTEAFDLNAMALPTPGIDKIVEELESHEFRTPIIFNIYSQAEDFSDIIEEHKMLIRRLAPFRPIAIEVNRSCPNPMPGEKSLEEQAKESLENEEELFKEIHEATDLPVIAKLSPKGDYVSMAETIAPHVDYICCGNTYPGTIISAYSGYPVLSAGRGGMSGTALLPINQLMTLEVSQAVGDKVGIIGCGGIRNAEDAVGYIRAGATYIQVGTALAYEEDPIQSYRRLWHDMLAIEKKLGKTCKELVGDCHVL